MNYRHAFHAGNFADVFKHAVLLRWLTALTADAQPLELFDTHAGAGAYDLAAVPAGRTGEAQAGIARVLSSGAPLPAGLPDLAAAVRKLNRGAEGPLYPGSPLLAAGALRAGDRYVGCELRADDAAMLEATLRARITHLRCRVLSRDGYSALAEARPAPRRAVLIDPPFEREDEPARLAEAVAAALARGEPVAIWAPIKDLDGFDRLLGRLEALRPPPSVCAEVRLRPLDDPLRLNGCAMILLGGPDIGDEARELATAVVALCGEPGGRAVVERFGG